MILGNILSIVGGGLSSPTNGGQLFVFELTHPFKLREQIRLVAFNQLSISVKSFSFVSAVMPLHPL